MATDAHEIYRFRIGRLECLVPALVVLRGLFPLIPDALVYAFTPRPLEALCIPLSRACHWTVAMPNFTGLFRGRFRRPTLESLTWATVFPSARQTWQSVFRAASEGRMAVDLPKASARILSSHKGLEVDKGQYVTLTKEEIREALPKSTQTIEIEAFVKLEEVPLAFFNKPYYVSPISKGQKAYALLRDVLRRTCRVGLGRVVVSTKQHLALVAPQDKGLVVALLRWAKEVRDMMSLPLPGDAEVMGLTDRELKMGEQLVLDMAEAWSPERFRDEFTEKVKALVEAKRKSGAITQVVELIGDEVVASADIIDLTELLKRSLKPKAAPGQPPSSPVWTRQRPSRTRAS